MEEKILKEKLIEIDNSIKVFYSKEIQIGVLAGISGVSLFQFYYSKYLDVDENASLGSDMLSLSIDKINDGFDNVSYCSGIAGLGWTIDHLGQEGFIEDDNDELLSEIDTLIYDTMISDLKIGKYDFLHGAIGHAFYFFNRYRNTKSNSLKNKYKDILIEFVKLLEEQSIKGKMGMIKWLSRPGQNSKIGSYDLGLSHGIPSILGFLTKLYHYEDFKIETKKMLKGSIQYILNFMQEPGCSKSLFPFSISQEGELNMPSRLAWCYGDLGIGISLWNASKALNDLKTGDIAIKILRHSAERVSSKNSLVVDAGICHGSFGNAQIFNRIYRETDDIVFKKAAIFWIQDGLSKGIYENGYAGFKQWSDVNKKWYPTISLLEGIAGIGLTIIDHLSDFDSNWDECLMIS